MGVAGVSAVVQAGYWPSASRRRETSLEGGTPKRRLYSRLNCDALS